jgi:hypothetical protein
MTGSVGGGGKAVFITCIGSLHCLVVAARSIDRSGGGKGKLLLPESQSGIFACDDI